MQVLKIINLILGAYTISMFSKYNSIPSPIIYGYYENKFHIIKKKEKLEDVLKFWE
jgi:hypothetical protein